MSGASVVSWGCDASNEPDRSRWSDVPVLSPVAVTEIGGANADGPAALSLVRSAVLLPDSSGVAITDWSTQEVRVFDSSGVFRRRLGGKGNGPGEFRSLEAVSVTPNGALVGWDSGSSRLTIFEGERATTFRVPVEDLPLRRLHLVGVLADTTFVFRGDRDESNLDARSPGVFVDTLLVVGYRPNAESLTVLGRVESDEQWFFNLGPTWGLEDRIFGAPTLVLVAKEKVLAGKTSRPYLRVMNEGGGEVRFPVEPLLASASLVATEREVRLDNVSLAGVRVDGVDLGFAHRTVVEGVNAADTVPYFKRGLGTPSGTLWMKRFPLPGDTAQEWIHFDGTGNPLGRISLPPGSSVLDATAHALVTRGLDEFDATVITVRFF